jgi:S1-C subfamily serine protease
VSQVHVSVLPGRRRYRPVLELAAVMMVIVAGLAIAAAARITAQRDEPASAPAPVGPVRVSPGLADVKAALPDGAGIVTGTGMVLTPAGRVLTNNHVIEGAAAISVADVGNGRTYAASVVGYDASQDVAVLQLTGASRLRTVPLGTGIAAAARVGEQVTALGNAGGRDGTPLAASGTVTGLGVSVVVGDGTGIAEHLSGLTTASLPLRAGDSGGPLISPDGLVIGMNTAVSTQPAKGSDTVEAFAIPIASALGVATAIVTGRASATVHIGPGASLDAVVAPGAIAVPGTISDSGAGVTAAPARTPAASAGLTFGDVIVALGGHRVTSAADLSATLFDYSPGDRVSVGWVDQRRQAHTATVALAVGPAG